MKTMRPIEIRIALALSALLGIAATLPGCASKPLLPDVGYLYDKAAMHTQGGARNPVIVIPGILGSKLTERGTDRVVWGAFAGNYADPRTTDGVRLVALPMGDGRRLDELTDNVFPAGALDRLNINLLGIPIAIRAYVDILGTLGVGGYRDQQLGEAGIIDYGDEHYTCFQFAYDWRRDNAENARLLGEYIQNIHDYVTEERRKELGPDAPPVKFDIVAHSMGGLLTRHYLRYGTEAPPADGSVPWKGAELVERVVMVGTPNAGSADSIENLVEGRKLPVGLPSYDAVVLGTMPAIYQLLPRHRHGAILDHETGEPIDVFDLEFWDRMQWGLANPKKDALLEKLLPDVDTPEERRRIAREHLAKCLKRAEEFHEAMDRPAVPPPGLQMYAMVGDAVPTPARLEVDQKRRHVSVSEKAPGDGIVLRSSVLADERISGDWEPRLRSPIRFHQVMFLFSDHLGLTKDPVFTDNVLYILLESPRPEIPSS